MSGIFQQQASRTGLSPNAPDFVSVEGASSQQSSFAQQRSFSFQAIPHPSLFTSANIGSISNCVLNLVQSSPKDPSGGGLHENASKHQKLDDSNRWKFSSCFFVRTDKMDSFIWRWHRTKFALFTLCPSYFRAFKNTLTTTGVTFRTFYHYSLQKIFVNLNCCNFALSWT